MDKPIYTKCIKCNRKLKTERAKSRGYGDYCWRQHQKELKSNKKTIFQILENMEK